MHQFFFYFNTFFSFLWKYFTLKIFQMEEFISQKNICNKKKIPSLPV